MERELDDNLAAIDTATDINNGSNEMVDYETEKAILSLCMRSKNALNDVVSKQIVSEDFADKRNRIIFDAISNLYIKGDSIDRVTLLNHLASEGEVNAIGGTNYFFSVANCPAVLSNIQSYIDIVLEKSKKRKFTEVLTDMQKKAAVGSNSVKDLVDIGINNLSKLQPEESKTGFQSVGSILRENINHIAEVVGGKEEDTYKTHFRGIDAMTGGFRPGTLNIIAARPGMGKTALVINIATNVAAFSKRNVVIFSLEMSKAEIGNRILSSRTDYSAKQLQRANTLKENDMKMLSKAYKNLMDLNIYIDDNSNVNPISMKSTLTDLKNKGHLGLVIVDYLQLMSMPNLNKNSSRQNEISDISRSLKILSKEFQVPIIALSQLSRGSEKREDHTPMLSDLRDSGAIEQDADCVIFINREAYYKKDETPQAIEDAHIIIAKNRHGETGKVPVKWFGAKTLFFEEDSKYTPQDPVKSGMQSESTYTRTVDSQSAASDFNFEGGSDVPPEQDVPPFDVNDVPPPFNEENDAFFEGSSSSLPDGFF